MWFKEAGPYAYWLPVAVLLTLVLGLVAVIAWGMNKRFPPAVALFGLFVGVLAPLAAQGMAITQSLQAVAHASAEMKATLIAAGISVSIMMHALPKLFLMLPALGFIVLTGAVAAIRGERRPGPAIIAIALGGLTALASAIAAYTSGAGYINAPAYAVATIAIAAGLSSAPSSDPEEPNAGPTAAAAAALAFPILVTLCEMGTVAMNQIMVFEAVAHASSETKITLMTNGLALVNGGRLWSWLAIAAAWGVALLGAAGAMDDDSSHNAGVMLGLMGAVAGTLAFGADAAPLFEQMMGSYR